MLLKPVDTVDDITPEDFKEKYYKTGTPVVIRQLAKQWPAYEKWTWDYLKTVVGDKKVGIYNNVKSDAFTPVNKADEYILFGDYIDRIRKGPAAWRIFLFNIFAHAPQLRQDFTFPKHLMSGFVERMPMLFTGGEGSITHMHFDIDLSHIMHTQFMGKKRVLLFPYNRKNQLYRKPYEVLSLADFSNYYDAEKSKVDYHRFPHLKEIKGLEITLQPGDTLFMPGGYWHHMEYIESGFAMSLRALNPSLQKKINGLWNIVGMRNVDTLMKKAFPAQWYNFKVKKIFKNAAK